MQREEEKRKKWETCAQYYESQAEALKQAAEALVREDKQTAKLYKKRAQALGGTCKIPGLASTYFNIAGMQVKGETDGQASLERAAQCYENQAAAFKFAIEALSQDKEAVQLYEKRGNALGGDYNILGAGIAYLLMFELAQR